MVAIWGSKVKLWYRRSVQKAKVYDERRATSAALDILLGY